MTMGLNLDTSIEKSPSISLDTLKGTCKKGKKMTAMTNEIID
jgi:hypothetical protein